MPSTSSCAHSKAKVEFSVHACIQYLVLNTPGTVRLLLDSYARQYAYMRWNNRVSTPVKMENGVKQGGIRLLETDVGCHVGHMSYAAFTYGDDLLLLSPSIPGLEMLVKTSESFAGEYGMTRNAKKTECICFDKKMHVHYSVK